MDSHIIHPHHQGEEEDPHEKKSVLKKVKEKAKKIKEKITHGHGHDRIPEDHDLDEEDDEEDLDLEVHGATTIRSGAPGQGDILKVPMVNFGDTKAMRDYEDPVPSLERTDPMRDYVPGTANQNASQPHSVASGVILMHDDVLEPRAANYSGSTMGSEAIHGLHNPQNTPVSSFGEHESKFSDLGQTFLSGNEGHLGQSRVKTNTDTPISSLVQYKSHSNDPSQTFPSGNEGYLGQSSVHTNTLVSSLGECLSKVTDPSDHTFEKEGYLGKSRAHINTPVPSLGDYKSNVINPSQTFVSGKEGHSGQSRVNLDRPRGLEEDSDAPKANPHAYTPSNYQTKVTDPTNAGGEEIGITPILQSLDKMNLRSGSHEKPSNQRSYTEKISSATSTIADKAISAKNAVASKLGMGYGYGVESDQHPDLKPHAYTGGEEQKGAQNLSTGSHDQFSAETENPSNQSSYTEKLSSATSAIADKAISSKNVVANKLGYSGDNVQHENKVTVPTDAGVVEVEVMATEHRPHQELSTYTEKISSATSAIADKAASAKNSVASKLGYGGDNVNQRQEAAGNVGSGGTEEHGKGIAGTVTEKLTPVYEKVAGVGSTVMSKIHGGGSSEGATRGDYNTNTARQDKGVSVKDYLSEKLRPGEEDRALSEVISETLHKRKAEQSARPRGKVTESVEVTRRLGPDYGTENVEQSSYGKVVTDTLKGAVGSLFGKAGDQTTTTAPSQSQQSFGSSTGTEGFSSSGSRVTEHRGQGVERRRLQGSGN